MSQVQVRQVPYATSTDAQRVVGSWFPSGYYGHFRAKSRADLSNYFRQLARPVPPKKFVDRQTAEATNHMFSLHDNRFKFEGDPLVRGTQAGFGKRRSANNIRGEFDPLFVSWVPKNIDRKAFVDDAKISAYADDYNHDPSPPHVIADVQTPQTITSYESGKPSTPSSVETSVYSSVYKHGQPNYEQSKQIRQETYQRFRTTRTRLSQQKSNDRSASVASCLVWNQSNENNKIPLTNDRMINIVVPITLQPRVNPNHNNVSPRQRAQSAGPRLMSTGYNQSPAPALLLPPSVQQQQQPFQSQSMQMFKTTIATIERPHTATTTSREHYQGANFGLKVAVPPRAMTTFEQTHTNSMDNLIAKYM